MLVDCINRRLAGKTLKDALLESATSDCVGSHADVGQNVCATADSGWKGNTQAQVIIPMAISIAFSLIVATIWILFLVPALFGIYACLRRTADPALKAFPLAVSDLKSLRATSR